MNLIRRYHAAHWVSEVGRDNDLRGCLGGLLEFPTRLCSISISTRNVCSIYINPETLL